MESSFSGIETGRKNQKNIIRFENGIYGFESVKEFILLQREPSQTIWSLQAAHAPYPSLIVINPFLVFPNYQPVLSKEDLDLLGNPEQEDLCFLAVAVLKQNLADSVVNLKSPIVINAEKKVGRQVILEDCPYPVRFKLFHNAAAGGN
jgi:flagellar assembly factor FliW